MAYNAGLMPFTANGALAEKRRVKITSGTSTTPPQVEYAGATDKHIGVTEFAVATTEIVTVKLNNVGGSFEMTALDAIAKGAICYAAADGKISASNAAPGTEMIGVMNEASTANNDIVEVIPLV